MEATEADIDRLYKDFIPYQLNSIPKCSALIPGALETFENIKKRCKNWQYYGLCIYDDWSFG
jgi:hypothetical protein